MSRAQATLSLFAFWLVLTASTDPLLLAVGAAVSFAIASWAVRRLWVDVEPPVLSLRQGGRFALYVLHLIKEIVAAAILVAEKVLDPRMPIAPVLVTHRVRFEREVSRVALANSITLTPGTLTVDVDGDAFVVHCLAEEFAGGIVDGSFERRIKRVFEEGAS